MVLVSVVMMQLAAAWPPSALTSRPFIPWRNLSMGSGTPMTPVEATSQSSAPDPNFAAAASAISRAVRNPSSPVAALAFPALKTMPLARPLFTRSLDSCTGAAATLLVVKTPATEQPRSARMTPTSLLPGPGVLRPA